jgi:hypothetical protein
MSMQQSESDATADLTVQDHQSKNSLGHRILGGRDWLVRLTLCVRQWISAELEIRSERARR